MARTMYEFYCNDCDGWILLTLSQELRGRYMIECPNCHHQHPRTLVDGKEVKENSYEVKIAGGKKSMWITRQGATSSVDDVITPMKSAYSKTSRIDKMSAPTTDLWVEHAQQANQLDFSPVPST